MKKRILLLSLCLCVGFTAMAQFDSNVSNAAFTNKRGVSLLPIAGDYALGIDAAPFLTYLGGIFSNNDASSPSAEGFSLKPSGITQTVFGKYFLADNRAIRARLSINLNNTVSKNAVRNDEDVANNPLNAFATAIDVRTISETGINLGVGYEYRRGKGRVQGFYGGELGLGYGSGSREQYKWANPMTSVNQNPNTTTNWNNGNYSQQTRRTIEVNSGKTVSGGLSGFAGVEYFFAPQMSIGGEFYLGFWLSMTAQTETTTESWNVSADKLQTQTSRGGSWDARTIDFQTLPRGHLFLMFHF